MNIADKETLDRVHAKLSNKGTHVSVKSSYTHEGKEYIADMYYLLEGTEIICDTTFMKVSQLLGVPSVENNKYIITNTTYVYIYNLSSYEESLYTIV